MRTSRKCIEAIVSRINEATRVEITEWRTIQEHGSPRNVAPVGAYTLDCAYGGYSLHRYVSEGGAVEAVIDYRVGAGEMERLLRAFLAGICTKKKL